MLVAADTSWHDLEGYINCTSHVLYRVMIPKAINSNFLACRKQDNFFLVGYYRSWLKSIISRAVGYITSYTMWTALERTLASQSRYGIMPLRFDLHTTKNDNIVTVYLQRKKESLANQLLVELVVDSNMVFTLLIVSTRVWPSSSLNNHSSWLYLTSWSSWTSSNPRATTSST